MKYKSIVLLLCQAKRAPVGSGPSKPVCPNLGGFGETLIDFSRGSEVRAFACNAGDLSSIPGSGRSPGEGNGNPLQYSCLENHMDRGAWWATVHRVTKSQTQLIDFTFITMVQGQGC